MDAHWYALLGEDSARADGVLVFGTSSIADCSDGAPCCEIDRHPPGPAGTGLLALTHFNGCALLRCEARFLNSMRGELNAADRSRLLKAVEDGTGVGTGMRAGSKRGALVRLNDDAKEAFNTRYGVLLTEHVYSTRRRYHIMVPLVDDSRGMARSPAPEWTYIRAAWGKSITRKANTKGFFAISNRVESVYCKRHIETIYSTHMADPDIYAIEQQVQQYLAL
jgi:hypothetical protein